MSGLPKQFIERLLEEAGNEEEMLAVLDGLGLSISEAEGMNVISLEDDYDDDYSDDNASKNQSTLRLPKADLTVYLQEINKDQLIHIAKRFDPKISAKTVAPLKKAIEKALVSPKHIKALIENLNPLEEELLLEVKRRGGFANGWGLVLHALQLGFQPEPSEIDTSLYRVEAAEHAGAKFLLPLLRDGLLLPSSTYASWFERHYYGYEQNLDIENDIVQVDKRILAALKDKASPKAIAPKFKILKDAEATGFIQKHPLEAILKLIEVVKLIDSSGGLQTNKDGTISKNAIKKLVKLAPWLEDEFERYLELMKPLGLLDAVTETGKIVLKINPDLFYNFQMAPSEVSYCTLFDGYIHSVATNYDHSSYQYGLNEVVNIDIARRTLIDAVCMLPDEPVDLDAALKIIWKQRLRYIMRAKVSRAYYGSSKTVEERPMPGWFRHAILQELHTFGLVALKETGQKDVSDIEVTRRYYPEEYTTLDATNYAIKTTIAKDWWHKGRAFNKAMSLAPVKNEATFNKLAKEHLGPKSLEKVPAQKSLLVQANFDILVYLDMLTPLAIAALNCADCTRIDAQTANYTISRSSVYRALEMGMTLETLLELLEENSHDIPNNVKVSMSEWASRRERLSITTNTNLLEYATSAARDKAQKSVKDSRAVGERFLLVLEDKEVHKVATTLHNYRAEPKRIIEFQDTGKFSLKGASDLAGRAVLASLAIQDSSGNYQLSTQAIQAGNLTKVARESLLARTKGGLPKQLSVLIDIWSGKTNAPAVGQVSIFQHASAIELSKHPSIAPLLDGQLGTTSFLIKETKTTELNKVLKNLGITASKSVEHNLEPKIVEKEDAMKKGLPTRKMREMIEAAIVSERKLKLKYNEEKQSYDRYGYTKVSKGKAVTEEIHPDSVFYEGSTPYFYGKTVEGDKGRNIRIGYITEFVVL